MRAFARCWRHMWRRELGEMATWERQPAIVRATNALIRTLGGTSVRLRVSGGTSAGTERELGITSAAYEELEVCPVVLRRMQSEDTRDRIEVVISAGTLEKLTNGSGAGAALEFLKLVVAVVYGDDVFQITNVSAETFGGLEYMYRVRAER